jgi:hypothetical protein
LVTKLACAMDSDPSCPHSSLDVERLAAPYLADDDPIRAQGCAPLFKTGGGGSPPAFAGARPEQHDKPESEASKRGSVIAASA